MIDNINQVEIYHPRATSDEGVWDIGTMRFKVYGLLANGRTLTDAMMSQARRFMENDVVDRVAEMGDSNNLGFTIIHPGDLGLSISAHWWVQGCVLCQHFQRQIYGADTPLDTASRPVIGCVWELAVINKEQQSWRDTMMTKVPDPAGYLAAR